MNKESLKKLHKIELEILERFVQLCEKHNIRYYVIGGTLIGAVRHKGFIPWDDDIDIAVPREDYDRLIEIMHSLGDDILGMDYYKDDEDLYFYPIRITNKQYKIRDPRAKMGCANPWIDILPIDGLPDNIIARELLKARLLYYRLLLGFHYVDNLRSIDRPVYQRFLIWFGNISHVGTLINPTKIKDKITRALSANNMRDCKMAGTCMGAYFFHEFTRTEYFGNGSEVEFEKLKVKAPQQIHSYLTHMFGEYMELPPEEERVAHDIEFIA